MLVEKLVFFFLKKKKSNEHRGTDGEICDL